MNILIIGGSSDVGQELATFLLDKGNKVTITYNRHRINVPGIDSVKCDIRFENEIENTIKNVINKYGKIDILINMAARYKDNNLSDKTKEEFMEVLEVNLVGSFLTSKIYSKYTYDGLIINIASTDGIDTFNEFNIDYAASKAGLITMSKNLALCTNNKVFCICPNWIDSDSTNSMDKNFLDNELNRIKQERLITKEEFIHGVYKIINEDSPSGTIYRLDIKENKLWIMKI